MNPGLAQPDAERPHPLSPTRVELWMLAALVGAAAGLRLWAARGDMWFDELETLDLVQRSVRWPWDVLLKARVDNNHPLMTLWVFLLGPGHGPLWYRLPSVAAGGGSVVAGWMIGRREGRTAGWFAGGAIALSYVMVNYDSEARGYALFVMGLLGSYWVLTEGFGQPGWGRPAAFWTLAALAVLGHVLAALALAAMGLWALGVALQRGWGLRRAAGALAAWFALPAALIVGLYLVFVRHMGVLGSPPYRLKNGLAVDVAALVGGPAAGAAMWVCAVAGAAVLAIALALRWRRGAEPAALMILLILGVPPAVVALNRVGAFYPRYILGSVALAIVLLAAEAGRWLSRGGWQGAAAGALAAIVVALNFYSLWPVLAVGKGQYSQMAEFMIQQTPGGPDVPVNVCGSFDATTSVTIEHAKERVPGGGRLRYFFEKDLPRGGVEWHVYTELPDFDGRIAPIRDKFGNRYLYVTGSDYDGLSGFRWLIYRLEKPGTTMP